MIDVLELPTLTQDLVVFAPPALLDGLIDGVKRVHGVLHLLFHPAHLHRPEVREALRPRSSERSRKEWNGGRRGRSTFGERARRSIEWTDCRSDQHRATVTVRANMN